MNNTATATPPGRQQQHPPSTTLDTRAPRRRVGLIDRLTLRVGVALVAWSRRPREFDSRERRARRIERDRSTEHRERQSQRVMLLLLPPR